MMLLFFMKSFMNDYFAILEMLGDLPFEPNNAPTPKKKKPRGLGD